MPKAQWNGAVLAASDACRVVEGNQYFPASALNREYFEESSTTSVCPWKGLASYYNIKVAGAVNKDAAWYYANPTDAAGQIKGYVAFWKGVEVTGS